MNSMIDKNVDKIPPMEFGYQGNLVESIRLPNGNSANRYHHKNGKGAFCFYMFEVDGKSRRIIDWRIEGNEVPCYDR